MGIQITLTVVGLGVLWEAPKTELGSGRWNEQLDRWSPEELWPGTDRTLWSI